MKVFRLIITGDSSISADDFRQPAVGAFGYGDSFHFGDS
jgi:hypothetical protein